MKIANDRAFYFRSLIFPLGYVGTAPTIWQSPDQHQELGIPIQTSKCSKIDIIFYFLNSPPLFLSCHETLGG